VEIVCWLRDRDGRVGLRRRENKSVNREEEEIVKTTKLSLTREIIKLPLPHQHTKGYIEKSGLCIFFLLFIYIALLYLGVFVVRFGSVLRLKVIRAAR